MYHTNYGSLLADSYYRIAQVLARQGKHLRAATNFQRTLENATALTDGDPNNASLKIARAEIFSETGWLFLRSSDPAEAQDNFEEARDIYDGLLETEPAWAEARIGLATALHGLSRIMEEHGYVNQAVGDLERGLALLEGLDSPRTDRLREDIEADLRRLRE